MGVDPLDSRDGRQNTVAAAFDHFELEPGNVAGGRRRGAGAELADHGAAVDVLPVRPYKVAADGLAVEEKRRDGLARRPGELAVCARLAFVDLRAFGMQRHDYCFTRGGKNRICF